MYLSHRGSPARHKFKCLLENIHVLVLMEFVHSFNNLRNLTRFLCNMMIRNSERGRRGPGESQRNRVRNSWRVLRRGREKLGLAAEGQVLRLRRSWNFPGSRRHDVRRYGKNDVISRDFDSNGISMTSLKKCQKNTGKPRYLRFGIRERKTHK